MPDASPTKWHRAHTSWFFEEFVLDASGEYQPFDATFRYLFNSYYEAVGPRHPRPERGLITRPSADEVGRYRAHVDAAVARLIERGMDDSQAELVELAHGATTWPSFLRCLEAPRSSAGPSGGHGGQAS